MKTKARLKIQTSDRELMASIIFVARDVISNALIKASPKAIEKIRSVVRIAILSSETFSSLLAGILRADFGLTYEMAQSSAEQIIQVVTDGIEASYNLRNDFSVGSVTISLLPVDLSEIADIPAGSYISINNKGESNDVHWLRWLLLYGSEIVVDDYRVEYSMSPRSRSGEALMKKDGMFRVDPQFAGTENDNFLTRAISDVRNEIIDIIRTEFIGAI